MADRIGDIEDRLDALESASISVDDLPMAALQRSLENDWQPEGSTLLLPGSVTPDMLSEFVASTAVNGASVLAGRWSSTGSISEAGTGGWSVSKTATGTYAVTLNATAVHGVIPALMVFQSGAFAARLSALATTGFTAVTFTTTTGTATDVAGGFVAFVY